MALWGSLDASNNAPKQTDTTGYGGSTPQVTANGQVYYGNTKTDAFITNAQIGIYGIDTTEKGITTGDAVAAQHAGWNLRKAGMGPVLTITANSGAVASNSYITFSGGSKVTDAIAFSIDATATIAGALMCTVASCSSGVLYSVGNFTGGSRAVASGDTLNVTYTTTLT